jgi:hypothetical protein
LITLPLPEFDGMSDPPDDLYTYGQFSEFNEQLYDHKDYLGATNKNIVKIRSGKILHVLREAWASG